MSYNMRHAIAHDLTVDQARRAVNKAFESYLVEMQEYHPKMVWLDDAETQALVRLTIKGKTIDVKFVLASEEVKIEADLPLFWKAFTGKIKAVLGEEVQKWIDKVKAGEL